MNEKLNIDVKTLKPFTKFIYTIGELPTSYLVSMTYEEQLIWLCNYLNKTVIPTINNNGEAVKEVQDLVLKLQEYMNNYFNNLDVQREINKKLDEMAEDGTLTSLISNYVQPLIDEQNNRINTSIEEQNNRINGLNNVVTSVASGSPAGVYETLTDLINANPDHTRIYVVLSTNHWYYYNTTSNEWTDGGLYLSNQTPLTNQIQTDVEINRELLTNTETSQRLKLEVEDFEIGGIVSSTGVPTAYNKTIRSKDFIIFENIVKLLENKTGTAYNDCTLFIYNNDGTYITFYNMNTLKKYPFISPTYKFKLLLGNNTVVTDISDILNLFTFNITAVIEKDNELFNIEQANLINPDEKYENYAISSTGLLQPLNNYSTFIFPIDNTKKYYSDHPEYYSAFYDENFNVISVHSWEPSSALSNPITPPNNAKYFGTTKETSSIGLSAYVSTKNQYYEYGTLFNNIKDNIIDGDKPVLKKDLTNYSKLKDKKILFVGDSITSTDYTKPVYWEIIQSKTGAICTNNAVSGTSLAHTDLRHLYGGLNADEIGYIPDDPSTWLTGNCICERIGRITDGDYDAIVIMGGTNDLYCSKGDWNSNDISKLYGALNYIITNLCKNFPSKKIIMCTPIQKTNSYNTNIFNPLNSLSNKTTQDLTLQELCEGIKQKCNQYSIPCVDLFNDSGINGSDENKIYYRTNDTVHPSSYGEERIASLIIEKLGELFN